MLFLHGFPQTATSWRAVTRALAGAGVRTVALDQRGYSPGARPSDVASYALARTGRRRRRGHRRARRPGAPGRARLGWGRRLARRVAFAGAGGELDGGGDAVRARAGRGHGGLAGGAAALRLHPRAAPVRGRGGAARGRRRRPPRGVRGPGAAGAGGRGRRGAVSTGGADRRTELVPRHVPLGLRRARPGHGADDLRVGRARPGVQPSRRRADRGVGGGAVRFVALEDASHWLPDEVPDLLAAEIAARVSGG